MIHGLSSGFNGVQRDAGGDAATAEMPVLTLSSGVITVNATAATRPNATVRSSPRMMATGGSHRPLSTNHP
jgi:hypothetical protein